MRLFASCLWWMLGVPREFGYVFRLTTDNR